MESAEKILYRAVITLMGHRLDSMDETRSKPDPFAVLKVKDTASGDWVVVGKTSKAEDTRDPEFPKGFVLPFDRSQEELMVRVEMMDYISSREKILIGTAEYNLMKILDSDHGGVRVMLENPSKEQPGEVTIAAKKIPLIAECFYKLVGAPEGAKVRMEYKMSGDENDPWLMVDEKPNYKRAKQNVMRISLIPLTRERLNKTQLRLSVFKEDEEVGSVSFPLGSFRSHLSEFTVPLGTPSNPRALTAVLRAKLGTLLDVSIEVKNIASRDAFGKSDPFAVVYMETPEWTEMGRTETHFDTESCKFKETFLLPYFLDDDSTPVLIRIFDRDDKSEDLDLQELCGQVDINLADVANTSKEYELLGITEDCGTVVVTAV